MSCSHVMKIFNNVDSKKWSGVPKVGKNGVLLYHQSEKPCRNLPSEWWTCDCRWPSLTLLTNSCCEPRYFLAKPPTHWSASWNKPSVRSYEFACLIIPMQSCKHQQWAPKLDFLSSPSIPQVQNIDPLILKRPWASADLFSCLLVPPVLFHRQLQVGHVAHLLSVGSIITHENLGELQMETGALPNTWKDLARPSLKKENKDEWLVTPIFTPWKKLRHKSPRSHGEEEIAERLQAMPFRVTPAIGVQLCGRQT